MATSEKEFLIRKNLGINTVKNNIENIERKVDLNKQNLNFKINRNLGINTVRNNIEEFRRTADLNQQNLNFQINRNIKTENVSARLENVEVLNKKIDVTTGKTKEFRDYGIYTISGEPIFSISDERMNVI